MMMEEFFKNNSHFTCKDNIYYQAGLSATSFAQEYFDLRQQENRILSDEYTLKLPDLDGHQHSTEWLIRKWTADAICERLRSKEKLESLVEIGCGNGWLSNYIHQRLGLSCAGIESHDAELKQAGRLFYRPGQLMFVCGDLFSSPFDNLQVDVVLLAASVHYFSNVSSLVSRLKNILTPEGEIHIVDSPFYASNEITKAAERTNQYFKQLNRPAMANHYFHHSWSDLNRFNYRTVHNPKSIPSKIRKVFNGNRSPFPYIVISK